MLPSVWQRAWREVMFSPYYWSMPLCQCPHLCNSKPHDALLSQGSRCPGAEPRPSRERDLAHEYGPFHWWPQMNSIITSEMETGFTFSDLRVGPQSITAEADCCQFSRRHTAIHEEPPRLIIFFHFEFFRTWELWVDILVKLPTPRLIVNRDLRSMAYRSHFKQHFRDARHAPSSLRHKLIVFQCLEKPSSFWLGLHSDSYSKNKQC